MFRGVDLLAFDETGTSDPYVLLRIGSIQHQTDVIYHSLAPTWNENFMFSVNSLDKDLHLTVVDKDPEYDDLMANYRTHLGDIPLQVSSLVYDFVEPYVLSDLSDFDLLMSVFP